ncbi:hypothetical protein Pint_31759 [Pistacia integerrima]|uniref:Uncharacterized protein n=1 Tax=Pistacia integerrima TaxID=434235 RepID=A0ACC0XNG1_9ROSI|nr:hypothetical protein Pint_31759 [Pistacia integerrima]
MYSVVTKLRKLKPDFRALNRKVGNLRKKVNVLRGEVENLQTAVDRDPSNKEIREQEMVFSAAFMAALIDEERFRKQKPKILWLAVGDQNSFFHYFLRSSLKRQRIERVLLDARDMGEGPQFAEAFVSFYKNLQGKASHSSQFPFFQFWLEGLSSIWWSSNYILVVFSQMVGITEKLWEIVMAYIISEGNFFDAISRRNVVCDDWWGVISMGDETYVPPRILSSEWEVICDWPAFCACSSGIAIWHGCWEGALGGVCWVYGGLLAFVSRHGFGQTQLLPFFILSSGFVAIFGVGF